MVDAVRFSRSWLPKRPNPSELDATLCRLEIRVHNHLVTEFVSDEGARETHLEIPSYYLAEWIAENWWSILYEPRKDDDTLDDPDFLGRHSTLSAQHGFPLPALSIVAAGQVLHLNVLPREVPYAGIRFTKKAYASGLRADIEKELWGFVKETVERLNKLGVRDTPLQDAWTLVAQTGPDEREFCELMGMLGLSPYDAHEQIEACIEHVEQTLGSRALRDLALASSEKTFVAAATSLLHAAEAMERAKAMTLAPLSSINLPADNLTVKGWKRGVLAAQKVRQHFNVQASDPKGGRAIFSQLNIDPDDSPEAGQNEEAQSLFSGFIEATNDTARMNLFQGSRPRRNFTAARATYLAWISDRSIKVGRLVTHAVTRDQQAGRAFAAELLAPIGYIRSHASGHKLEYQRVFDLATELGVEPGVVAKQAQNNGIVFASP